MRMPCYPMHHLKPVPTEALSDKALSVWQQTGGAVLVDDLFVDALTACFGVDGTETFEDFPFYLAYAFIIEAKVGTGTEVAVELLHLVALFALGVERTEVRFVLNHIFKSEVGDNFIIAALRQFAHNGGMFAAVCFKPSAIGHFPTFDTQDNRSSLCLYPAVPAFAAGYRHGSR